MIRFTTPALPLEIEGIDLTNNEDVYVSFTQGNNYFEKRNADLVITAETHGQVTTTSIIVLLSQEETGSLLANKNVDIQVNYINAQNLRDATEIASLGVGRNLKAEIIEYGN